MVISVILTFLVLYIVEIRSYATFFFFLLNLALSSHVSIKIKPTFSALSDYIVRSSLSNSNSLGPGKFVRDMGSSSH